MLGGSEKVAWRYLVVFCSAAEIRDRAVIDLELGSHNLKLVVMTTYH